MRRLASIFLLAVFGLSLLIANPCFAAETEEQKLKQIQQEIEANREKLLKTKQEEQAVLGRLAEINKELTKTKSSLDLAQNKVRLNESQIGYLSTELKQSQKELSTKEEKLRARLREVYKNSGVNYVDLLFFSRSLSDFLNRFYFFQKVVEYDSGLVGDIQEEVDKTRRKKETLQQKTEVVRQLAVEIEVKKNEIAAKAQDKKEAYDSLKQRRQEYEDKIAELEKSSLELETLIMKKTGGKRSKPLGSGLMAMPTEGRFTSSFGWRRHPLWGGRNFHTGQDIANKYGTPIKAADSGEVIFAGWWDGYGKAVVVDHGRGMTTVYGHLSRIYQQVGAIVAKGQVVGLMGSTGYSTGPHLHFEVRINGKPVNPTPYL